MRKLSKREIVLIASFIIVLILYFGVKYWYFPLIDQVNALQLEKERYATESEQMSLYKGKKETIQAEMDQMNAQIDAWKPSFLSEELTYKYWSEIVNRAKHAGVKVTQMQEGDKDKQTGARTTQLRVSGLYSEVTAFMESLELLPYVHAVIDGNIQIQGGLADASFSIVINTGSY